MKLATFLPPGGGEPLAGEVRDGGVVAFDPPATVLGLLADGARGRPAGAAYALDDVVLMAPHVPRAIFCIGLNYRRHARGDRPRAARRADRVPQAALVRGAAGRPRAAPAGRAPAGLRGRAGRRHGPRRRGGRLHGRRRRQRPRPAGPRAAVDAGQGAPTASAPSARG